MRLRDHLPVQYFVRSMDLHPSRGLPVVQMGDYVRDNFRTSEYCLVRGTCPSLHGWLLLQDDCRMFICFSSTFSEMRLHLSIVTYKKAYVGNSLELFVEITAIPLIRKVEISPRSQIQRRRLDTTGNLYFV